MLRTQFARYWLPVIIWMAIILGASTDLMSTQRTSRIIGPILRWFNPDITHQTIHRVQFFVRKGAHVVEYAVLALLIWRARRHFRRKDDRGWRWADAVFAVFACAIWASVDELHQHFVPARHGSVGDVLLDTAGAGAAMAGLWLVGRWRKWW